MPKKIKAKTRNNPNPIIKPKAKNLPRTPKNFPLTKYLLLNKASNPFLSSKTEIKMAKENQIENKIPGIIKSKKPPAIIMVNRK